MDLRTLIIPLAFILLAAVLCLLLIGTKWRWWQKLALIVIVPCFGLVVWDAVDSYKGWPAHCTLPAKAIMLGGAVREPDPATKDPGEIFLWLTDIEGKPVPSANPLEYVSPGGEPRAFRAPYSRRLHKAVAKAKEMIRQGRPPVLDLGKKRKGQKGRERPGGEYGRPDEHEIEVYDLPPPQPPTKD